MSCFRTKTNSVYLDQIARNARRNRNIFLSVKHDSGSAILWTGVSFSGTRVLVKIKNTRNDSKVCETVDEQFHTVGGLVGCSNRIAYLVTTQRRFKSVFFRELLRYD